MRMIKTKPKPIYTSPKQIKPQRNRQIKLGPNSNKQMWWTRAIVEAWNSIQEPNTHKHESINKHPNESPRAFLFHRVSPTFFHICAPNYKPSYLCVIFRSSLYLYLSHIIRKMVWLKINLNLLLNPPWSGLYISIICTSNLLYLFW